MRRTAAFLLGATMMALFTTVAVPSSARALAVEHVRLAQMGGFDCLTGELFSPETPPDGFGDILIQQRAGRVSVLIRIRNGAPETTYVVRLVQIAPVFLDCSDTDLTFTTNKMGRATVKYAEAIQPETIGFNVVIDTGYQQGTPTWVGERMIPR